MADSRIDVTFGADFSDLVSAAQQVKDQLGAVAASAQSAGAAFASASAQMSTSAVSNSAAVTSAFGLIDLSVDSLLKNVLFGTQTWQQAMTGVVRTVVQGFIQGVSDMILSWLEFQAITATIGAGAGAAFSAGGLSGLLGGLFGTGSGALSSVGAVLPMFDVGTWSVPSTGLAMLHQGEIVVPPALSDAVRGGGASLGGAGGTMNLSIGVSAIDARSVVQGVVNNPTVLRSLAAALARYSPQNPSVA